MFPNSVFSVFQNGLSLISPNYLAFVNTVFIPVMKKMRHPAKKQAVEGERDCSRSGIRNQESIVLGASRKQPMTLKDHRMENHSLFVT